VEKRSVDALGGISRCREPRWLLIAEDDEALRQMLRWEFEEMGYRVITASTCIEALSSAAGHKVDLALLDYNLPDGVGTDLLRALRKGVPDLPVVIYSGRATRGKADEAEKYGASRFISKPVAASSLHAIFQHLLPTAEPTPGPKEQPGNP
jgi:DNA-binding NtrC family response regulator